MSAGWASGLSESRSSERQSRAETCPQGPSKAVGVPDRRGYAFVARTSTCELSCEMLVK